MNINQSTQDLITTITVSIEPSDYLPPYKSELAKLKSKVSLKGFRQGKTPDHVISKMYGESVLADVLNKSFQSALEGHINQNNLIYVCQPILAKDQEQIEIKPSDKEAVYTMSYEIGTVGELHIGGIGSENTYTKYAIEVSDQDIESELTAISKQMGDYQIVDSAVKEFDRVILSAVEMEEGVIKKDGWQSSFDIYVSSIPDIETKNSFTGKNKGESVICEIAKITRMDKDKIRKELLKVDEDDSREIGDIFHFTIETIERHTPAEITDEKIEEYYGEYEIKTVDDLKTRLKENLSSRNADSAIGNLYQEMHKNINENSVVTFSDEFVKRWLKESESMDDVKIEEIIDDLKKDLKWNVIQQELQKRYQVSLDYKEVDDYLRYKASEFMERFGYYDPAIFDRVYKKFLSDKKEVFNAQNAIVNNKIFKAIEKDVTIVEESITLEAFNKLLQPEQTATETVS
jgi:trigger factor